MFQDHFSNNLGPKIKNLESPKPIEEWMVSTMRLWKPSSDLLKCNCFPPSTFLTNNQSIHLYPHVYGQLQGIPIWPPQTHPSFSIMIETLTNVDYYCFSHNYPFEATKFSTKALHQQFDLGFFAHWNSNGVFSSTYL